MERRYFKHLTGDERQQLKKDIFQQLGIEDQQPSVKRSHRKNILRISLAACLIGAAALLIFLKQETVKDARIFLASTRAGEIKKVKLTDGSLVILNPNSSLYAQPESQVREVFLSGNGFFKVRHLSGDQPFIVHARSMNVTVLGTEFGVDARTSEPQVALTTGKVAVSAGDSRSTSAILSPGQKMTLKNSILYKAPFDVDQYSAWTKGEWLFRNTSLSEISLLIKDYYGAEVTFKEISKRDLKMTAVIPVTTLESLVQVIRETLPVKINISENKVLIQ